MVGRLRRRFMRADVLEGWLGDDAGAPQTRGDFALRRFAGGGLGLSADGTVRLEPSAKVHAALAEPAEDTWVTIGWPEPIVVVRRRGVVVAAEGDFLHFGELALDEMRTLRRTGYDYVDEVGPAVRVHLELEERGAFDPSRALRRGGFVTAAEPDPAPPVLVPPAPLLHAVRLAPGADTAFGPYALHHGYSFEHERRPIAGRTGHGYDLRLSRTEAEPPASRTPMIDLFAPPPADEVVAAARSHRVLLDDEVLAGEPDYGGWLASYEGPRSTLEAALRAAGPIRPQLRVAGDGIEVHGARLGRTETGEPIVGRVVIRATPFATLRVSRTLERRMPGRLRRLS